MPKHPAVAKPPLKPLENNPTPIKPPPVPKPVMPPVPEPEPKPEPLKPEPKPLVYCTECTHLRYTKQSVEMGFEPLCAAVPRQNQFIARSGPLSYEKCSVVNPDGHCRYYTQQTPPRTGFWSFAFGESQA